MASILFITTLSLSSNPRLFKELLSARDAGHQVHVLFFRLGNWTDAQDEEKMMALPEVGFIRLSATRSPFIPWLISSLLEQFARKLTPWFKHPWIQSMAAGKRAYLLESALRGCKITPDWVIAHNPAAFLPANRFATRKKARFGIDVEDYHPGEPPDPRQTVAIRQLMCYTLSGSDYVSFAAPLIRREVARDMGRERDNWMTILNWFPSAEFLPPTTNKVGPLRLVWFSQIVTARRGLELVLPAIIAAGNRVELHIFGQPDPAFTEVHIGNSNNIFLHGTVSQRVLHQCLARFDIGLAIDVVSDRNRELAITNKILTYLQAGLFLAVTATEAQCGFMADIPEHGALFSPNSSDWERLLDNLLEKKEQIRLTGPERFSAMRSFGWEQTSQALVRTWNS